MLFNSSAITFLSIMRNSRVALLGVPFGLPLGFPDWPFVNGILKLFDFTGC
jgi:hypothetical protein